MDTVEDKCGTLLFFRKNGEHGTSYPLTIGKTCIGSSNNADIRLKLRDERLEEIHCIIDVTDNGIATILNKSHLAPVCVNTVSVRKFKVLHNEDQIELIGKKFQYLNDNISKKDVERHQILLTKAISTPTKKRQSVAPIVNLQSTKKTTNFKTKIPVQKKLLTRRSLNGNHRELVTPERKCEKSLILERPKTTSKLITSKALSLPHRTKKRRLSMGNSPRNQFRNPKVSERNIQLPENYISSTILEEEPVPSTSQLKGGIEGDFIDFSNTSFSAADVNATEGTFTRRSSMRTPSRSSTRIKLLEATPIKTQKFKAASSTAKFEALEVMTPSERKVSLTGDKTKTSLSSSVNKVLRLSKTPSNQIKINTPKVAPENKFDTPKKLRLSKTPLTPKTLTPVKNGLNSVENKSKTPKNTSMIKKLNTKGTQQAPNEPTSPEDFINFEEAHASLSSKSDVSVKNSSTPDSSKSSQSELSDTTKKRRKCVKNITPLDNSICRRKIDSNRSVDSDRTSKDGDLSGVNEILNISSGCSLSPVMSRTTNLSSTDSDISEGQKDRQTQQYLDQSFGTRHTEDEERNYSEDWKHSEETWQNSFDSESIQEKDTSVSEDDMSDIKPIFVPQRRPSLRRSYINESKKLSVRLSRSLTPKDSELNNESEGSNSNIEDYVELTTPKSAIKSRRSKSLPYKPIVEDITPVTLQESSEKNESSFKTPINTPGLFEDLKMSALKSRGRRRFSSNLMETLNKEEVGKAIKRLRESTESTDRSPKKRKIFESSLNSTMDEDLDASFASFSTDEVFCSNTADEYVAPNTPNDFKNLTDKPLITDPQARSLTEPRRQKLISSRRSLHAIRLETQLSDDLNGSSSIDTIDDSIDSSVGSRRSSRRLSLRGHEENVRNKVEKSTMKDVSNITGLKKLFDTPKEVKSPKNDLRNIRGIKRLLQTPRPESSPKNDLTNIVGIKKLMSTPNVVKSPKNDLTQIPNLRKLVYPTVQNNPKNDLSDVAGVKKLLTTPRKNKSPKNDLRNVPNLRRIMSPQRQNSPKNDLSDVAGLKKLLSTPKKQKEPVNDLTNIAGVKKLLSTPKKQNSPINDLTKVPNLRRMMSPKQQNSPKNDLSDVGGVADIFAETELRSGENDVENNENLFDKLFVRKPIKTYRGRSLSPITRKAMVFGGDQRKSLGDTPYSSPRIEKWLEDQAVIRLERMDDAKTSSIGQVKEVKTPKATPQRKRKAKNTEEPNSQDENKHRGRTRGQVEKNKELTTESPRNIRSRQKRNADHGSSMSNTVKDETEMEVTSLPKRRGRLRKIFQEKTVDLVEYKRNTRRNKILKKDEDSSSDVEIVSTPRRRNIIRTVSVDETANSSIGGKEESNKNEEERLCVEIIPLRIERNTVRFADPTSQELVEPPKKINRRKIRGVEESLKEEEKENENLETKGKTSKRQHEKSEPASKTTGKPLKRTTRRNIKELEEAPKDEDENIHINLETNETQEYNMPDPSSEQIPEPVTKRRGRKILVEEVQEANTDQKGDQKERNLKSEATLEKLGEVVKRGRRKVVLEADDISKNNMDEGSDQVKKRSKRQVAKDKTKEAAVEEISEQPNADNKKGSKRGNKESNLALEKVEEPVKRGKRKTVVEDVSKDNTEEEVNVVEKRSTRRAAKNKTIRAAVEENFENSPRTRQRKGNFKKYGSDFITEVEKESQKNVSFEETNMIEQKHHNVEQVEEVKETLRRSKRTRK